MIRQVQVENGWVRGLPASDPRITSYKGIPFAAPPVGPNRWRAPQPCADWEGVKNCYEFAPISMQPTPGVNPDELYSREWHVDPEIPMSEDCLYLNIWAPAQGQQKLPVYVWYFGGGLQVGYTAEMEFDGERLARRGVIVVTVNYRVNAFGFLAHPEITAEAPDKPANFGFLDQQFATRWVQRNIAAFGGDPENITIGGQSAGGMSVGAQIGNPANKGLFRRAIIESGMFARAYPSRMGLDSSLRSCEEQGEKFFAHLGVKTLAEARALDTDYVWRKALEMPWGYWRAAVDGHFLHHGGNDWYRVADRVVCPVMAGCTNNEFFISPPVEDEASLAAFAREHYGTEADRFLACFRHPADQASIREDGTVSAIDVAVRTAQAMTADSGMPLYSYEFGPDIPGWDNPGAFHSVDLWFFFESLAKCWRPFKGRHYDLARQMCDYWANFIKTGDPNGLGSDGEMLPPWQPFTQETPVRMGFRAESAPETVPASPLMQLLVEQQMKQSN